MDREELEISDQVQVMAMVTIHEQVHKSTMNLLAPIVLNPKKGKGKQVVLHQTGYSTRNLIWTDDQLESIKGGE
ncbi:Flagellar assembly factor FliW [compost metagenome]